MKRKYGSHKVEAPEGVFDSKREYLRFCELKLKEEDGEISDLMRQVKFELIPKQRTETELLRPIEYIADFVYRKDGKQIVEDVKPHDRAGNVSKSFKGTAAWHEYMIKKKLMKYILDLEIEEV